MDVNDPLMPEGVEQRPRLIDTAECRAVEPDDAAGHQLHPPFPFVRLCSTAYSLPRPVLMMRSLAYEPACSRIIDAPSVSGQMCRRA